MEQSTLLHRSPLAGRTMSESAAFLWGAFTGIVWVCVGILLVWNLGML